MTRTVVHFEIPANDPDKVTKFYTDLFGWKSQTIPEMGYWMIETKSKEGELAVTVGLKKKSDPNQRPTNYISVESVDEYSKKISQLGGKIIMPKTEVPGRGFLAVALDLEDNPFGIWERPTGGTKDPVCNMDVDEKTSKLQSEHGENTYYFCSPSCKSTFDKNPEKYAK